MKTWRDHNYIKLFHELPRPLLFVWNIAKDMVSYVLDLIGMCWKALCTAMNKNVLVPAALAAFGALFVNYGYDFALQIMNANNYSGDPIMSETTEKLATMIFQLLSILPLCWGLAIIASVVKAKDEEKEDGWQQHKEVGEKAVRFFMNFVAVAGAILMGLLVLNFVGKIPQIGKPILSLLVVPFYFASMVFWLTVVGLFVGSFFFGAFYLSGKYEESASLMDRAKSLYCMAGSKIIDFVCAGIPAAAMAALFVVVPAILTMASIHLMEWPSKDIWSGFRFPDVATAFHNTNEYPSTMDTNEDGKVDDDDDEVERLLIAGNNVYPTVETMQTSFDNQAKQTKEVLKGVDDHFVEWQKKDGNEEMDRDDFAESINKSAPEGNFIEADGEGFIVTAGEWTYSAEGLAYVSSRNENDSWSSDNADGSEVEFTGESHSKLMLWLTALILVFSSSAVFAIPAGFIIASIGATSYRLYNTDYSGYAVWKRLLVLCLPLWFVVSNSCVFSCMNDMNMQNFKINFGQDRKEISREAQIYSGPSRVEETYDASDYDYDDYDDDDAGW